MSSRVLIVDDERALVEAMSVRLRAAGYHVVTAGDGLSGLAAARAWCPDLILLDIRMPDIDGFEVNRRLKQDVNLAKTPVVFVSANVQESARQTALADGAFAFLPKPYEPSVVMKTVKEAIARAASLQPFNGVNKQ